MAEPLVAGAAPFLQVRDLTKAYRGGWGLHEVSFDLPAGTIAVLGGPNGSGKSTLLRCLAGLAAYEGTVRIGGRETDRSPASRATIGYLPQAVAMPDHATVGEVLGFFADLRGVDRDSIPLPEGFVRPDDDRIGVLSGGQRHRVALAVALLGNPRLLLLDEPVAGLDEEGRETFWTLLLRLRDQDDVTSVVSSPSPSELRSVVDRALFMDDGWLVLQEEPRVPSPGTAELAAYREPDDLLEACP